MCKFLKISDKKEYFENPNLKNEITLIHVNLICNIFILLFIGNYIIDYFFT